MRERGRRKRQEQKQCDRLTLLVCVVDIEKSDVVSVNVSKPHL